MRETCFAREEKSRTLKSISDLRFSFKWKDVLCLFMMGIIAHMSIIVHSHTNHDSVVLYGNNFDWLLSQGKWFVTPLASLEGEVNISYLTAIIGIMAMSVSAVIYCASLHVSLKTVRLLIGLCFVSFPSVATTMLYQGADIFALAFLLSCLGAYFIIQTGVINNLTGLILIMLSVGAYQAMLGAVMLILVIDCLMKLLSATDMSNLLLTVFRYFAISALAAILYYAVLQYKLADEDAVLSSYRGIDNMTSNLQIATLLHSILGAVKNFASFIFLGALSYQHGLISKANVLIMIPFVYLTISMIVKRKINNKPRYLICLFVFVCLFIPLSANVIGVLAANRSFYYVSVTPFMIVFTIPLVQLDRLVPSHSAEDTALLNYFPVMKTVTYLSAVLIVLSWNIQNNTVYQMISLMNESYAAKVPVLVSDIHQVEGYTKEKTLAFVGEPPYDFLESSGALSVLEQMFETEGYGLGDAAGDVYHYGILSSVMNNKYSFGVTVVDKTDIMNRFHTEIDLMPIYPDEGSILILEDMIVVKLSETKSE